MNDDIEETVNLRLIIPLESYQKIMAYTQGVDTEITQFADITLNEDGELRLGEVYLLKQEAAGAHVDMEEEDVADFMVECIKKGMTQLPQCWIHSHVDMGAYFSGTDVETYTKTLNNGNWAVALVVNKRQDMEAVFQQYKPFLHTWKIPIEIDYQLPEVPAAIQKEIQKKVKEKKTVYPIGRKKNTEGESQSIETYANGGIYRNKSKKIVFTLPKNREDAIAKIDQFSLSKVWDEEDQKWKFVNHITNSEYIDYWEVVQNYYPNREDWSN